ncbi:Ribosomal protein L9/RNase H1, N-terminal [Sesbania bispinosa]|nr:Ribosomal protein L9/RNase H1, N-terminal [Sesbania bispinosa]
MSYNHHNRSYVVTNGRRPRVYTSWVECHAQIVGIPTGLYISYDTLEEGQTTRWTFQQQTTISQVLQPPCTCVDTVHASATSRGAQRDQNTQTDKYSIMTIYCSIAALADTEEEYQHEESDDNFLLEYKTQIILSKTCSVLKIPQPVFRQYATELKEGVLYYKMRVLVRTHLLQPTQYSIRCFANTQDLTRESAAAKLLGRLESTTGQYIKDYNYYNVRRMEQKDLPTRES